MRCRLSLPGGAVTMTVDQRSTTPIEGSGGAIRLTIDDITRGQVITSISTSEGEPVLAPVSMRPGDASRFHVDGQAFRLRLETLQNVLIGMDHAVFSVTPASARATLPVEDRIQRLLDGLRHMDGVTFIRNGVEYDGQAAAEHLELKRRFVHEEVASAEDFIEKIASRSSETGQPYRVRLADGKELDARDFFTAELAKIDSQNDR